MKEKIEPFYNKHYKKIMFIPVIIFVIAIIFLLFNYAQTGEFVKKDVTLKGGISATVYTEKNIDIKALESSFPDSSVKRLSDLSSGKQLGVIIEVSNINADELKTSLEKELDLKLNEDNFSLEETGASLGASFYKEMIIALIIAFLFMGIVVFITFKNFIPSIAVMSAAIMDIIITLAIIDLIGMKISTAGITAFLLIIGYSIDTDILLTSRTLKGKEGSIFDRMFGSVKTGLTMTGTTIAALLVATIFTTSFVIKDMFTIIIIALVVDIFATYFTNTGILKWYLEKKNEH